MIFYGFFLCSIVDLDASTVVFKNDVGNLDDFVDEDVFHDFPHLIKGNGNAFDILDISRDSSFNDSASQELKCPCCQCELGDFDQH